MGLKRHPLLSIVSCLSIQPLPHQKSQSLTPYLTSGTIIDIPYHIPLHFTIIEFIANTGLVSLIEIITAIIIVVIVIVIVIIYCHYSGRRAH